VILLIRCSAAVAAMLLAAWFAVNLPLLDGPTLREFLALMILPAVGALAIAPRTIRLTFAAGAIYAALAGLRRLVAPEGNATAAEQLSTAAIVALLIPVVWQFWRWSGARLVRSIVKGSQSK